MEEAIPLESSHGDGAGGDVVLLGSINADHFIYVERFPRPGETLLARGGETGLGGKGANQAVAAGLAGARVHLIGRVGRDAAAGLVRERLEGFGIGTGLLTASDAPTGAAYITVDAAGENTIAVVSGANAEADLASLAESVGSVFGSAGSGGRPGVVGLSQGEVRAEMIEAFARHCAERGARFVLNLAPVIDLAPETVAAADPLVLNEGEAQELLERRLGASEPAGDVEQALALARRLAGEGIARSVVVTLGGDGAVVATPRGSWHQPSPEPDAVVDTTGAGDAFVGALAARLAVSDDLRDAARWAVCAGTAAVASRGTTASYPSRAELGELVRGFDAAPADPGDVPGTAR